MISLSKNKLSVAEFCAQQTFATLFVDVGTIDNYAPYNCWLDLYVTAVEEEWQSLVDDTGEKVLLAEKYTGAYLPELLEYQFYEIKYLVGELVRNNVALDTYED